MEISRILWSQLRIGVIVTISVAALALLIFFIDDVRDALEDRYTLHFRTFTTQALRQRAPVWLAGQPVGHVSTVRFDPPRRENPQRLIVDLSIAIDAQPMITEGAVAQVITASLLGQVVVNILPASEAGRPLQEGDELPSAEEIDPSKVVERLAQLNDSLPSVTERWRQVLTHIRHGEGSLPRMVRQPDELRSWLITLDEAAATFDRLSDATGELANLLTDAEVSQSLSRIGQRLGRLATLWLETEGSLGRLAADTTLATRLASIARNLDLIRERVAAGHGTLGRLLHDEALANELTRTRKLLWELKADFASAGGNRP